MRHDILRAPRRLRVRVLGHVPAAAAARGEDVGFERGRRERRGVEIGGVAGDVACEEERDG